MVSPVQYEPAVIERFAAEMYRRARTIVIASAISGAMIVGFAGYSIGQGMPLRVREEFFNIDLVLAAVGAVIGGAVGVLVGLQRAFWLRFRAQTALCQLQIEKNTRAAEASRADVGGAS